MRLSCLILTKNNGNTLRYAMESVKSYVDEIALLDSGSELPVVPNGCEHNAHMFYIKCGDLQERTALIRYLKDRDISAVFHYIPLHSAPAGLKYGRFNGEDIYTTCESERLTRLPMYYGLKEADVEYICEMINTFYK